jgi:NitT/TauT family transport system ATP-binding protein
VSKLAVENLALSYPLPNRKLLSVLGPITFEVNTGEFVCIIGPSGCGKSSLIRVLAGLQRPTQGQALHDDQPIDQPQPSVALMFQDSNLMPWRTLLDNVVLPLELGGMNQRDRYKAAREVLPRLGLQDFERAYPSELSGGMKQRAALGRVFVQQPDVLLLDEPFGALDALTREQLSLDLLQIWSVYRQTVIMVTHSINEAVLLADRILVLSRRPGRLLADIQVDLPRPRSQDDTYSDAFNALSRRVREQVKQTWRE